MLIILPASWRCFFCIHFPAAWTPGMEPFTTIGKTRRPWGQGQGLSWTWAHQDFWSTQCYLPITTSTDAEWTSGPLLPGTPEFGSLSLVSSLPVLLPGTPEFGSLSFLSSLPVLAKQELPSSAHRHWWAHFRSSHTRNSRVPLTVIGELTAGPR